MADQARFSFPGEQRRRPRGGGATWRQPARIAGDPLEPGWTCPRCGLTSHLPADAENQYCGRCHEFMGDYPP